LISFGITQRDSSIKWVFSRVYPDGTGYSFKLPSGKALVVTDVDWSYNEGKHNGIQTFNIFMTWPGKKIRTPIFASTVLGDASGSGGESVSMTTGFVLTKIDGIEFILGMAKLNDIIFRGYLIDKPVNRRRRIKVKARKNK